MNGLDARRKRTLYRASHRGTKELDIFLGRFAQSAVPDMNNAMLTAFEELLALPDPDIEQWMRGVKSPDNIARIIGEVRAFHGLDSGSRT